METGKSAWMKGMHARSGGNIFFGNPLLTKIFGGNLPPLSVVVGPPGSGKTRLLAKIAVACSKAGLSVTILSTIGCTDIASNSDPSNSISVVTCRHAPETVAFLNRYRKEEGSNRVLLMDSFDTVAIGESPLNTALISIVASTLHLVADSGVAVIVACNVYSNDFCLAEMHMSDCQWIRLSRQTGQQYCLQVSVIDSKRCLYKAVDEPIS